tara:strand:- start:7180 stop:7713 length:534 start_codon:yes stop_codon:yes gene_type:complete
MSHFHKSTAALPLDVLEDIGEVIYTMRDRMLSVCVVMSKFETLNKLIGAVPDLIRDAVTKRYFVDLQSIGTDILRLYTDAVDPGVVIHGYYFDPSLKMLQKKNYKKVKPGELAVDRYDSNGVLVSSNEPEKQGDSSCWLGDKDFAARVEHEAISHGHDVRYTYKQEKPQSYLRVVRI